MEATQLDHHLDFLLTDCEDPADDAIVAAAANWVLGCQKGAEGSAADTLCRPWIASRNSGW